MRGNYIVVRTSDLPSEDCSIAGAPTPEPTNNQPLQDVFLDIEDVPSSSRPGNEPHMKQELEGLGKDDELGESEYEFVMSAESAQYVRKLREDVNKSMIDDGYGNNSDANNAIMQPGKIFWSRVTVSADDSKEAAAREGFIMLPDGPVFSKCRRLVSLRDLGHKVIAVAEHTRGGQGLEGLTPGTKKYEEYIRVVNEETLARGNFWGGLGASEPLRLDIGEADAESMLNLSFVYVRKSEYVKAADATIRVETLSHLTEVMEDFHSSLLGTK